MSSFCFGRLCLPLTACTFNCQPFIGSCAPTLFQMGLFHGRVAMPNEYFTERCTIVATHWVSLSMTPFGSALAAKWVVSCSWVACGGATVPTDVILC